MSVSVRVENHLIITVPKNLTYVSSAEHRIWWRTQWQRKWTLNAIFIMHNWSELIKLRLEILYKFQEISSMILENQETLYKGLKNFSSDIFWKSTIFEEEYFLRIFFLLQDFLTLSQLVTWYYIFVQLKKAFYFRSFEN